MTDTAVRLAGPAALTGTASTVYTVPASTQTIVRNIHAINPGAVADALFTLSVGLDDYTATQIFHSPIPVTGVLDWSGFMVLEAGEILQAATLVGDVILTISGIQVTP